MLDFVVSGLLCRLILVGAGSIMCVNYGCLEVSWIFNCMSTMRGTKHFQSSVQLHFHFLHLCKMLESDCQHSTNNLSRIFCCWRIASHSTIGSLLLGHIYTLLDILFGRRLCGAWHIVASINVNATWPTFVTRNPPELSGSTKEKTHAYCLSRGVIYLDFPKCGNYPFLSISRIPPGAQFLEAFLVCFCVGCC